MSRTRLEWAQWSAAKGLDVFIARPDEKVPLANHSWLSRRSTDPQQIADWFEEEPDCNYGLCPGNGHVVIDLDVKYGQNGLTGIGNFEQICLENNVGDFRTEIKTLMVRTPSGGYHLYFKTPHRCSNSHSFPDHIDVRGGNGYVIGPGSAIKGNTYNVIDPDAPITEIPTFLVDYLKQPGVKDKFHEVPLIDLDLPKNIEQAKEFLNIEPPAIYGEGGDHHTYKVACMLRDFGISEGMALKLMMIDSDWNDRCEPPWMASDLEVKISNSYEYAENRPGCKADTFELDKLRQGRPAGGWAATLSPDDVATMGRQLTLDEQRIAKKQDREKEGADEIPEEVPDTDPMARHKVEKEEQQFWFDVHDFAARESVREYIVKDWLIAHGITALLARRGTGKSTVALDLACHLAMDMDWWGNRIVKGWKVVYICGEDDEGMVLNVRAWAKQDNRGLPPRDRILISSGIVKMTDRAKLAIRLDEIKEWAGDDRCLVILDTWARAVSGSNTNAQDEMDPAYENAEMVADSLNGPMLACFHPPKSKGEMTIRGSAIQEDASSGIWELEEIPGNGVKLTVTRAKGTGRGNQIRFNLLPVDLEGYDSFDVPLQGIVPVKFAGTEEAGSKSLIESERMRRKAWAKAIIGAIQEWPLRNPTPKPITNTATGIANFITQKWLARKTTMDSGDLDYVEEWMDLLLPEKGHSEVLAHVLEEKNAQLIRREIARFNDREEKWYDTEVDEFILSVEDKDSSKTGPGIFVVRENPELTIPDCFKKE
jgi:hypothetical protein